MTLRTRSGDPQEDRSPIHLRTDTGSYFTSNALRAIKAARGVKLTT